MQSLKEVYQYTAFQCHFELGYNVKNFTQKQTFNYVSKIIHSWVKEKFSQIDVPRNPLDFSKDTHSQKVKVYYDPDNLVYCILTEHMDNDIPNRAWITEAELKGEDNGKITLSVKNQYTTAMQGREYSFCTVPSFVWKIYVNPNLNLKDGGVKVGGVREISSFDELEELHVLVETEDRMLPVVVISESNRTDKMSALLEVDGYHVDGGKFSNDTLFIAHTFLLPVAYQRKWEEEIGHNYAVYGGAIRTYYPQFNSDGKNELNHPITGAYSILKSSYEDATGRELIAGHAFRHLLTHKLKLDCMYQRIEWSKLGIKFYYRLAVERDKTESQNYQELISYYESEYDSQSKQLKQKEEELEEQKAANRRLKSANSINQRLISSLRDKLKEYEKKVPIQYPKEYKDIPGWVDLCYAGRIFLHPRAVRALKDAQFNDVEFVCKVIEMLGDIYYRMKTEEEIKLKDFLEAQLELGVIDCPTGTPASVGTQGDEYYVSYDNRKVFLNKHIKYGVSRDKRDTFRLYYSWDDNNEQVIIGYLPDHLHTRNT